MDTVIEIGSVAGRRRRRSYSEELKRRLVAACAEPGASVSLVAGNTEPDMLTAMTERDWSIVLDVFDAAQSSRGEPGHDDRKFLTARHDLTVHSITWRALPSEYGNWNSVWQRFWRLSRSGVFEAFFQLPAEGSRTAHLVQCFDSTTARAHVSAAGAKAGSIATQSAARAEVSRPRSTSQPISTATLSTST